jgi:predicted transcriptional regulator
MEVLRCLAQGGPQSVRTVAERLEPTRGWTRTTVLNQMERLRAKGHLVREPGSDGVFLYRLVHNDGSMVRGLVSQFVSEMLGGSVAPFVAYLTEDAQLSDDDLTALKAALARLEERS